MNRFRISVAASSVIVLSGGLLCAQRGSGTVNTPPPSSAGSMPSMDTNRGGFSPYGPRDPNSMGMPDPLGRRTLEIQEKTRNSERQKKIETDTQRLVQLVNDLKDQVDKDQSLSPTDLGKRAEEIEKLARSVKDKMKG
jgi:hypothetical protein